MECNSFSWDTVSPLLGVPFHSFAIQEFLARNNVDCVKLWQPVPIAVVTRGAMPEADTTEIDLKQVCGVRFRFKTANQLAGFANLGSEFVFSGITYFAEGEDGDSVGFSGQMPFGLNFSDTEDSVVAKLGKPSDRQGHDANDVYRYRRWDFSDCVFQAVFLSTSSRLRRLITFLPLA